MRSMRSYQDRAAAVRRVQREGLVPLDQLTHVAQAGYKAMERWILHGKRGVYLDGVQSTAIGWCSSEPAVRRFLAELEARGAGEVAPAARPVAAGPSGE